MRHLEDDTSLARFQDEKMAVKRICVLGAGRKPLTNFNQGEFLGLEGIGYYIPTNVDKLAYVSTDVVMDLSKKRWKFGDCSFDIVIAQHIIEHVPDRISFISECLRIAKKDGLLIIEVPNWCHETAHSNLEHLTTWSRVIFDDSYINNWGEKWKLEKVVYRITNPITWKSRYIKNEFIGRQLDKYTRLISGLTFFIRVTK